MLRLSLLGAVVVLVGCGQPEVQEVETLTSPLDFGTKAYNPPRRDCRSFSLRPAASGTVRFGPAMGVEVAEGRTVDSMYFETSSYGPERREGLVEFTLPPLGGRIVEASLCFQDAHGWQLQPSPADFHQISLYRTVDGSISTDDLAREVEPFAVIATDLNDAAPAERGFDLLSQVQLGGSIGFRFGVVRTNRAGNLGSGFSGFRLDVRVCGEAGLPDRVPTGDPF